MTIEQLPLQEPEELATPQRIVMQGDMGRYAFASNLPEGDLAATEALRLGGIERTKDLPYSPLGGIILGRQIQ